MIADKGGLRLTLLMLIRDQIKKAIPNKVRCSLVVSNLNGLHVPTLYRDLILQIYSFIF